MFPCIKKKCRLTITSGYYCNCNLKIIISFQIASLIRPSTSYGEQRFWSPRNINVSFHLNVICSADNRLKDNQTFILCRKLLAKENRLSIHLSMDLFTSNLSDRLVLYLE